MVKEKIISLNKLQQLLNIWDNLQKYKNIVRQENLKLILKSLCKFYSTRTLYLIYIVRKAEISNVFNNIYHHINNPNKNNGDCGH